jgi:hypothetical protein
MADIEIGDLSPDSSIVAADRFIFQDGSTGETKYVTAEDLQAFLLNIDGSSIDQAWDSFTANFTNLTVGNGTLTAAKKNIGSTTHFRIQLVIGSTSTITGTISVELPTTPSTAYASNFPIAHVTCLDAGNAAFPGEALRSTGSTVVLEKFDASSSFAFDSPVNATSPFSFGVGDTLFIHGTYERQL